MRVAFFVAARRGLLDHDVIAVGQLVLEEAHRVLGELEVLFFAADLDDDVFVVDGETLDEAARTAACEELQALVTELEGRAGAPPA